jgi:hypothetical protein
MQVDPFQQQQREEQVRLVAEHQPGKAAAGASLGLAEGQRADGDVGVRVLSVGVRVMAVVLADPPAVAQPDAQVAEQDAGDIVGPPGAEDLAVPGVMAQEPDLGEDHRQERGHRELPPRVAQQNEYGPSGGQQPDGDRDLPDVVARPPVQQPGLPDLPGQLRVLAAAPRPRRCGGQLDLPGHGRRCVGRSHRELLKPNFLKAHRDRAGNVPARSRARLPGSGRAECTASPDRCL